MAFVCLPPQEVDKFTAALRSGKIDPDKLAAMSSEERHKFFEGITGADNAQGVNALFESKLLLKNQQKGFVRWAEKVAGLKPQVRRDLMARISKMDHILNPAEEEAFLKDLASTKLGVNVTQDEAKTIAELSSKVQAAESGARSTAEQSVAKGWKPAQGDLDWGYAQYDLQKYVSDLKNGATRFHAGELKTPTGVVRGAGKIPKLVADVSKSIGASLDNSFALRQGLKMLHSHPIQWQKEFRQSFVNLVKGAKNVESANRDIRAHLLADPAYDDAVKHGLRIAKKDDVFPTSLPGKVPGVGRLFNASEVAYDGFADNLRLGLYKNEMRIAAKKGRELDTTFKKNMANFTNAMTGTSGFGKGEVLAEPANIAFYSLRFLKSNVETLLAHPLGFGTGGTGDAFLGKEGAKLGSYAQRRSAENLAKIVVGTAALLKTADALVPGSVEWDPRSTDFGQIKIKDTRFNVSGGMNSIVVLAARLASQSTKTSGGVVKKLNKGGFGDPTEWDVLTDFLSNKSSPIGGVAIDKLKGKTPTGAPFSAKNEATKLITPLGVNNFNELNKNPDAANMLAAMIADGLGISTNTYQKSSADWNTNPSVQLQAFKKKVGDANFKKANDEYNKQVSHAIVKLTSNPTYKTLPNDQKDATLSAAKAKVKQRVFDQYDFKHKRAPVNKGAITTKKQLVSDL